MALHSVDRLTPNKVAMLETVSRSAPISSAALRSCAPVSLMGRPRWRPLARADAMPARVRSTIKARSNSASAPKMWR